MMPRIFTSRFVLAVLALAATAGWAQTEVAEPAAVALVQKVSANEENATRHRLNYFFYSEERSDRTGQHLWLEAIAETSHGPLRRLLEEDGHPLDPARRQLVDDHVAVLVADPIAMDAENKTRVQDQQHGEQLLSLSPGMFLYSEVVRKGGVLTVDFRPNPAFNPTSYEQRVLCAMAGTIEIDEATMRMRAVNAQLTQVVKFGFGILGSVQSGSVHLVRTETPNGDFKPAVLDFKVNGHILFFHTLGKDQHLLRHGFVLLPANQPLADAEKLLMAARP